MDVAIEEAGDEGRIQQVPRSEAVSWALGLLGANLLALYTGLRMPSLWSINYFIASATDGFHRRALLGTMLSLLGDQRLHYAFVASIQVGLLALLDLVILWAGWRSRKRFGWPLALFLIGPCGGYLFHLIGYVDQLLYLLLMAMLLIGASWVSALLLVLSMLAHEMTLFTVVPVFVAVQWWRGVPWMRLAAVLAPCMLVFAGISLMGQAADPQRIDQFLAHLKVVADYPVREDYYDIFRHTISGLHICFSKVHVPDAVMAVLMAGVVGLAMSQAASEGRQRLAFVVGLCATGAPMFLGFFGWDIYRWIFLSFCSGMLLLYTVRDTLKRWVPWALACIWLLQWQVGQMAYFDFMAPRAWQPYAVSYLLKVEWPRFFDSKPVY